MGLGIENPFSIVADFEDLIAEYAGSRYAVAVESCSAALFLSCIYREVQEVTIPCHTYVSVPCSIINAGGWVNFEDYPWRGVYELYPYQIHDGAQRFRRGMYHGGLHCLSFHIKKHLPIGRGGMILTDSYNAYRLLKKMRFDGREESSIWEDPLDVIGWNMYMTPEQAARGIQLFSLIKDESLPDRDSVTEGYLDLSKYPIYQGRNK